ncbi:MAG TPA: SDR family NAD(P)-dependent oxidoreductase [Alphaproteobacteria bacterium]|nr:SDR family NAD(P)-dependent oxidoreductase [Alphaproteobacteria bacterium]
MADAEVVLIVGAGQGLSAALARRCLKDGMRVALASRSGARIAADLPKAGARAYRCDASRAEDVAALFDQVVGDLGAPDLVVYNASGRVRGPLTELDPAAVEQAIKVSAFGGFLVGQRAAKLMLGKGRGTILFTGASASVKGYPQSAPFAMGKFALRGLAQSMARELAPKNIHVGHFVIDGGIAGPSHVGEDRGPDGMLNPAAISETYLHVHRQHRSAWTWEVELRPWVEKF